MTVTQVDQRLSAWLNTQVQIEEVLSARDETTRRVLVGGRQYCHKHARVPNPPGARNVAELLRERDALSTLSLRGRRISAPSFAFNTGDDGADLLIEWVPHPSLGRELGEVFSGGDPALIPRAWHAALDALEVLHGVGLIHGDVQPGHLRFGREAGGQVRATLLDFGCTDHPGASYEGGLVHFMHPQVARDVLDQNHGELSAGIDLHGLLASFLMVLTASALYPFESGEAPSTQRRHHRLAVVARGEFAAARARGPEADAAVRRLVAALRPEVEEYSLAELRAVL